MSIFPRTGKAVLARFAAWQTQLLWAAIIAGVAIRLLFSTHAGHPYDMGINEIWLRSATEFGVIRSYREQLDGNGLPNHGPLEIALYAAAGHAYRLVVSPTHEVIQPAHRMFTKLPSILTDMLALFALYRLFKGLKGKTAGIVVTALYALHPVVIHNSAYWGQTDGMYVALLLCALVMHLEKRPLWTGVWFALACLLKPQAVIFAPLFLIAGTRDWKSPLLTIAGGGSVLGAVFGAFAAGGSLQELMNVYTQNHTFRLSLNAYNLWWAIFGRGAWNKGGGELFLGMMRFTQAGYLLFALAYAFALYLFWNRLRGTAKQSTEALLMSAAFIACAFFLLNVGMHERYMFAFVVFGLPLLFLKSEGIRLYSFITAAFFVNLLLVFPFSVWHSALPLPLSTIAVLCGAMQILLFIHFARFLWDYTAREQTTSPKKMTPWLQSWRTLFHS